MRISVITVCFNSKETLEQTIKSVVGQEYEDKEYIVIDGGSTDGTVDILKKYAEQIAFWLSEPDEGIYDAMNKGIKHATGDVIAFLNSDDWYEPDTLTRVAGYFLSNRIDCPLGGKGYGGSYTIFAKISPDSLTQTTRYSMMRKLH